ncbi:MAG: hypothetical protein ABSA47_18625 [Verrucomicrobiota bacterium]|jgi:hypothetical protein
MNTTLVAAAGEHYVAHKISCLGFLAALVRQGSPTIDLLASTLDGGRTVGIQVKTTTDAQRLHGRGANRVASELQFPLGHNAIEQSSDIVIFCFVDLHKSQPEIPPDVYVVPASALLKEYAGINIRQYPYFRHHRPIKHMEQFKNQWKPLIQALS